MRKIAAVVLLAAVAASPAMSQSKLDLQNRIISGPGIQVMTDNVSPVRKSPTLATFASLLVPGMGELYAGRYDVGKYSTIAEVSLWVLYVGLDLYSNQVRDDAVNYAAINSGADVTGKSSQFFVDIGNFLNTEDYNIKKIHDGYYGLIYSKPSYQWQWKSDAERAQFRSLRIKADTYLNYGRYTLAVIFLNHLISAVDAGRLAAGVNASAATSLDNSPGTQGVYFKVAASF